jgi:hypothetical protein
MYYTFGVWSEKSEPPRIGQIVNVANGISRGGDVEERRVTPVSPRDPGEGATRRYVIVEHHPRLPNVGRIVSETRAREEAVRKVRELDEIRVMTERVNNPQETQKIGVDPKPRKDFRLSL